MAKADHKMKLPHWEMFVKDAIKGEGILFVKGAKPDKLFRVATFEGAKRAAEILTKLRIKNWILFSVEGWSRAIAMMATGILMKDLGDTDVKLYVEHGAGGPDGTFPDMAHPDKNQIKAFFEEITA